MKNVDNLIEKLNDNYIDRAEEPIRLLAEMGNAIYPDILDRLKHEKRDRVVAHLLRVIGRIKGKDAIPLLLDYFYYSDMGFVRQYAVKALEEIGDYAIVAGMIQALEHEKMHWVREQIIHLIGELTVKRPIETLIENLSIEEGFVQEAAADAIYFIHKQITDLLLTRLEHSSNPVEKGELIEVLRMIKSRRAIPILQSMADDADKSIRVRIAFALKEINQD